MQISFSDLSFGSVGAVERRILQIDPAKESKDGAGKAAGGRSGLDRPAHRGGTQTERSYFKRRVGQAREPVTDTLLRAGAETGTHGRADGVPRKG